jgi:hypothetical protein
MRHVTQQQRLLSIVIQLSQIWYVVLQVQLELVLALYHGHGIRHQKHVNARIRYIIYLEHPVVSKN